MDMVRKSSRITRLTGFVFSLFLLSLTSLYAQEPDPAKGKKLFNANCAACHKLDTRVIGPPLAGVAEKRSKEWLYQFIQNSPEFIKKDADAKAIFDEYKIPMAPFPQLSHSDIDDIIAYTNVGDEGVTPIAGAEEEREATIIAQTDDEIPAEKTNWWWQPLVLLALIGTVIFFAKQNFNLLALFFTIVTLFSAAYFLFSWLMQIGVDTGYQPVQPIEFSHKIHAGDNGIDCEYCHSSAKHSQMSGIPSMNVCMNCHKFITEFNGETFGGHDKAFFDAEIEKVHKAAGWDKNEFAYTSEGKAVPWVRVHNLPDFVYYNHSQHVNVAGLDCQTCHGPVEGMHRVKQFSPLTMDWCISCHKDTQVKMDENGYYAGTYKDLKEAHKGATVVDMGGRECGKCHY